MSYVDGFVIPIPTKQVAAYRALAKKAGKIWMEHGALEYRECIGDDLSIKGVATYPKLVKAKRSETVAFSWIVYKSRADRDKVNAKVMADPRMAKMMTKDMCPFDPKRMTYGGFTTLVKY